MEKPIPSNDYYALSKIHTPYYYRYGLNFNKEAEEETNCAYPG